MRSRSDSERVSRIDLTDLVPPAADYLAHSCATMLVLSGEYARAGQQAWSVVDQDALARATKVLLTRYDSLHAILVDYVDNPEEAMVGPLEFVKAQMGRMVADRWFERVATCYVIGGFMTDFYRVLASGLPSPLADQVTQVLQDNTDNELIADVLRRVLELDEAYVSRVSLWSRRLVGDILLMARRVLPRISSTTSTGDRFEPLFTDVLLDHTNRLEYLGLTA